MTEFQALVADVVDLATVQEQLQGQHDTECVAELYGLYLDISDLGDCKSHGCSQEVRELFAGIGLEPAIKVAAAQKRRRE